MIIPHKVAIETDSLIPSLNVVIELLRTRHSSRQWSLTGKECKWVVLSG